LAARPDPPAPAPGNNWSNPEQYWQHPSDESLTLDLNDVAPASSAAHDTEIELDLPKQPDEPVDASISAGVFVAFGRFDEAERLLREALLQDRERDDLKLQLLDVYLQSDQAEPFEQLARSIEESAASSETLAELAVLRDSYRTRG
jgi:pilus assembly protein FimV